MVVVLHNVSIHIGQEVIDIIESAGCLVKFLPPYALDFNPIEMTFCVKSLDASTLYLSPDKVSQLQAFSKWRWRNLDAIDSCCCSFDMPRTGTT
jgi:transposase